MMPSTRWGVPLLSDWMFVFVIKAPSAVVELLVCNSFVKDVILVFVDVLLPLPYLAVITVLCYAVLLHQGCTRSASFQSTGLV